MRFLLLLALCFSSVVEAKTFYIDPVNGRDTGDGSIAKPWQSLQFLFKNKRIEYYSWDKLPYKQNLSNLKVAANGLVKGGDTLVLMPGNYGRLELKNFYLKQPLKFQSQHPHQAIFDQIQVTAGSNLIFNGVTIRFNPKHKKPKALFSASAHTWLGPVENISLIDSYLYSFKKLPEFTIKQWQKNVVDGVQSDATNSVYAGNKLENIGFALTIGGDKVTVEKNTINFFSGDGIRALGNYGVYKHNLIKNSIDLKNGNHDDGIQSWSRNGKPVTGVILSGNTIINYEDPSQPLIGPLQGIGLFDGFYNDWVIENNLVVIDQWHGITLTGFNNCKVINNTVVDLEHSGPKPWIMLRDHKNGKPSKGCIVRNNLMTAFKPLKNRGVVFDHNIVNPNPNWMFEDFFAGEFRLKSKAPAVDEGVKQDAPTVDILGNPRGPGDLYDIGAYEYQGN